MDTTTLQQWLGERPVATGLVVTAILVAVIGAVSQAFDGPVGVIVAAAVAVGFRRLVQNLADTRSAY
ncbi:MAG: hypothetical protein R2770_09155 [Acidimicrobiales bacterium]|nr:hypothetical protein [Acidimicrobiales bacterium]